LGRLENLVGGEFFGDASGSQHDGHGTTEHVGTPDLTRAFGGLYPGPAARHFGLHFDVLLVLIGQTAEQSPTDAADFGGVERQILVLGHFDRHARIVREERRTAQNAPTGADATQKLCFVARTDLAQFDAGAEGTGQIAHQIAEVDALVSRKIKRQA
jgi:hypothetical protein